MAKGVIFLLLVVCMSCSGGHEGKPLQEKFTVNCDLPFDAPDIVRTERVNDTVPGGGQITRYYDRKNRLRKKNVSSPMTESNSRKIFSIDTDLDTAGHIIHESKISGAAEVYCYRYVYDAGGNLVYKEGHSESMNIKVNYTYKDGKTLQDVHVMSR